MGTSTHVLVHARRAAELVEFALGLIDDLERRWSRFVPTSDVSAMNAAAGRFVAVSPATIELLTRATMAWHLTGGRFDPTVHDDVVRLGYDRSFSELAPPSRDMRGRRSSTEHRLGDSRRPDLGGVEIDLDAGAVRLPAGVGFDPGGIGKGLAADRITAAVMARGATGVLVNLGGDLRVRGAAHGADAWIVSIGEPAVRPEPFTTVALTEGAIATSTSRRRRWHDADGRPVHHIIDPATGDCQREAPDDIVVASAIAGDGWWAEAAATASIGRTRPDDDDPLLLNTETLCIAANGTERRSEGFAGYER